MLCLLVRRTTIREPLSLLALLTCISFSARPLHAQATLPVPSTPQAPPTPPVPPSLPTTSSASPSASPSPAAASATGPRLEASAAGPLPLSSVTTCANSAVALLGAYDASDGRIVVLRFAPGCGMGALPGVGIAAGGADTLGVTRLSPAVEAALAAKHAGAAAQSAAQAAKPSRRETLVALVTAVAVLLLK